MGLETKLLKLLLFGSRQVCVLPSCYHYLQPSNHGSALLQTNDTLSTLPSDVRLILSQSVSQITCRFRQEAHSGQRILLFTRTRAFL